MTRPIHGILSSTKTPVTRASRGARGGLDDAGGGGVDALDDAAGADAKVWKPGHGHWRGAGLQRTMATWREPSPKFEPVSAIPKDLFRVEIEVSPQDVETLRGISMERLAGSRGRGRGSGAS